LFLAPKALIYKTFIGGEFYLEVQKKSELQNKKVFIFKSELSVAVVSFNEEESSSSDSQQSQRQTHSTEHSWTNTGYRNFHV